MIKWLIILFCNAVLIWFVADYSYKSGAQDNLTATTYVKAADTYITLFMLRNKSNDEIITHYESELDLYIQVHRWAAENKSFLDGFLQLGQHKPNTEYYKRILDYRVKHPSEKEPENTIKDIEYLINNEARTF